MSKYVKYIISFMQVITLVIAFFLVLYINIYYFFSLGKTPFGSDIWDFFSLIIPFVLLMCLYFLNYVNNHNFVNNYYLYKGCSIIVMLNIIYIAIRSLFDYNLIYLYNDYHINFIYFNNHILGIKIVVYLLCFINIILIINNRISYKDS